MLHRSDSHRLEAYLAEETSGAGQLRSGRGPRLEGGPAGEGGVKTGGDDLLQNVFFFFLSLNFAKRYTIHKVLYVFFAGHFFFYMDNVTYYSSSVNGRDVTKVVLRQFVPAGGACGVGVSLRGYISHGDDERRALQMRVHLHRL